MDRSLRKRTHEPNTSYIDEGEPSVEEWYGIYKQLINDKFQVAMAVDMSGNHFSLKYFQKNGFSRPLKFSDKAGLGLVLPDPEKFSVKTVCKLVGKDKIIHVQCCRTQSTISMSMEKFTNYYFSTDRTEIYNVLSLEFSDTKMNELIHRPSVVNGMDWIDLAFPGYLKKLKSTPNLMHYPKVQKYCLMSVAGSYTTFHIDFGGTSVWYHVFKGKKIFWLIEPTNENLEKFEEWKKMTDDSVFLGDIVDRCERVELEAGTTFMIPSGWIHAVYTPVDSLVFGGNFVHSFSIPMQQRIAEMEVRTKVPQKQRFPLFNQLLWFVLERYVYSLTGKSFLNNNNNNARQVVPTSSRSHPVVYLTRYEVEGLAKIVEDLESTKAEEKVDSIDDLKLLHRETSEMLNKYQPPEDYQLAITGRPVISPAQEYKKMSTKVSMPSTKTASERTDRPSLNVGGKARRMVACKKCEACLTPDCRECIFCKDMVKYHGKAKLRKTCEKRQCLDKQPAKPKIQSFSSYKKRKQSAAELNTNGVPLGTKKDTSISEHIPLLKDDKKNSTGVVAPPENDDQDVASIVEKSSGSKIVRKCKKKNNPNKYMEAEKLAQDMSKKKKSSNSINGKSTKRRPKLKYNLTKTTSTSATDTSQKAEQPSSRKLKQERRLVPCKKCEACLRSDCGKCNCCKDMVKYGGSGAWKKKCRDRVCLNKQPPRAKLSGKGRKRKHTDKESNTDTPASRQEQDMKRIEKEERCSPGPSPKKMSGDQIGVKVSLVEGSYQCTPLGLKDQREK